MNPKTQRQTRRLVVNPDPLPVSPDTSYRAGHGTGSRLNLRLDSDDIRYFVLRFTTYGNQFVLYFLSYPVLGVMYYILCSVMRGMCFAVCAFMFKIVGRTLLSEFHILNPDSLGK